jgi:hypothetical protein
MHEIVPNLRRFIPLQSVMFVHDLDTIGLPLSASGHFSTDLGTSDSSLMLRSILSLCLVCVAIMLLVSISHPFTFLTWFDCLMSVLQK